MAEEYRYRDFIKRVCDDIVELKKSCPQLKAFLPDKHADPDRFMIDYSYKTHPADAVGGWVSGVPNPDPGGIWFHIDLHDEASTAQIHTQPRTAIQLHYGDKKICFLILEGAATASVSGEIMAILERHGAKP